MPLVEIELKIASRAPKTVSVKFSEKDAFARLAALGASGIDELDFGVVGMSRDGSVTLYSRYESEAAGLSAENVLGQHFFQETAPCMNNYLIAERFFDEEDADLDLEIPYILTFRMSPTKVRLRMLRSEAADLMYLLIRREA